MEILTFIIWSVIIILASIILVYILLSPKNFKQPVSRADRVFWSLVISGFAVFIFGIIAKPYIRYNYCQNLDLYGNANYPIFTCGEATWLILLFLYLVVNIFLHLLLFNMYYF